jgi:O-antigen ligase
MQTGYVQTLSERTGLLLACLLPFLVPFSDLRNIDMQALVLLIVGACCWTGWVLQMAWRSLDRFGVIAVSVYVFSCLAMLVLHTSSVLGEPYLGLGSLGLIACAGLGLVTLRTAQDLIVRRLYGLIVIFAITSLVYTVVINHTLGRVGGLVLQADVFAAICGVGFLLGLQLLREKRPYIFILAGQCILLTAVLLSQTRAVVVLLAALSIVWLVVECRRYKVAAILSVVAIGLLLLVPSRITQAGALSEGVAYRWQLQQAAAAAILEKPLLGYGPGNVHEALTCNKLTTPELQATCAEGYYFNSSHVIYLDRMLALGIIGGSAFTVTVTLALYRVGRNKRVRQQFGYATVLIALYYLTNVTSIALEMLLWVLLVRCLFASRASTSP